MHEWALAEAVISTVLDVAAKESAKEVVEITIVIGALQQIDLEVFKFAMSTLVKGTIAENAKIIYENEPTILKCRVCGHEWSLEDALNQLDEEIREAIHFVPELSHTYIKCPKCGSVDFEVIKGRGVYIKSIKIR